MLTYFSTCVGYLDLSVLCVTKTIKFEFQYRFESSSPVQTLLLYTETVLQTKPNAPYRLQKVVDLRAALFDVGETSLLLSPVSNTHLSHTFVQIDI